MTSIDQALLKAYERRRKVSGGGVTSQETRRLADPSTDASRLRELYVHTPQPKPSPLAEQAGDRPTSDQPTSDQPTSDQPTTGTPDLADLRLEPIAAFDSTHEYFSTVVGRGAPPEPAPNRDPLPVANKSQLVNFYRYEYSTESPSLRVWETTVQTPSLAPTSEATAAHTEPRDAASISIAVGESPSDAGGFEPAIERPPMDARADESTVDARVEPDSRFRPAWEVDYFTLPHACRQAEKTLQERLQVAVTELVDDCMPTRPVIAITSDARGEGRTTVSVLLARALAKAGLRVLLMEGDFEAPSLAERLGVDLRDGWDPSKRDLADLSECCIHSAEDRFVILPLSVSISSQAGEASRAWSGAVAEMATHFQCVVLDCGPGIAAWASAGTALGAQVIVRDSRRTSDEALQELIQTSGSRPGVPIRWIDNFAELDQADAASLRRYSA